MLCKEAEENLIDYIDNLLDEKSNLNFENHIKECISCKENLKDIQETIEHIQILNKEVKAPSNLIETVKKQVDMERKTTTRAKIKAGYIILVSVIVSLFVLTAFANDDIRNFLDIWKDKSLQESQSIEQLIANGYGEKINIVSEDKNIRMKIESIIADDINTVLLIEIEDLGGNNKYVPILSGVTMDFQGRFKHNRDNFEASWISLIAIDNIRGAYLLYTPEENKTRTVLSLNPVASEEEEIGLEIKAVKPISTEENITLSGYGHYYNQIPKDAVEGIWDFKVPIKQYESHVFNINEEMYLDGHKIIFEQLKISPTMTTLTYKYNSRQKKEHVLDRLLNIKIEANGKLYDRKTYGKDIMSMNNYSPREGMISFDTMYFEMPDKIKITVDGYNTTVGEKIVLDIDPEKPFPQDFQYLDSNIRVNKVQGDEDFVRISMDNLGEQYFEMLDFKVLINNKEYKEGQYATKFLFPEDEEVVYESSYDILLNNSSKTYAGPYPEEGYNINRSKTNLHTNYKEEDSDLEELILKDELSDKIQSIKIIISGYEELKHVNGSLPLKLKKYKKE